VDEKLLVALRSGGHNIAGSVRWRPEVSDHRDLFERAARAAELPAGTTIYSLRHSSIARALLRRVPIKLVADWHDTSVAMIERHYGRFFRATATISSAPRSSTLRPQS
jgi:hypothetical protein